MTLLDKLHNARRFSGTKLVLTWIEAEALWNLVGASERLCVKLEHPTASVTIMDQVELRKMLDKVSQ